MPDPPPATSMMWTALPSPDGVTRASADQCLPWSVENDSQPASSDPCVSQVANRLPAESALKAPSIHHSDSDIVRSGGPNSTGFDQVAPPSPDDVKYVLAGSIEYVVVSVM